MVKGIPPDQTAHRVPTKSVILWAPKGFYMRRPEVNSVRLRRKSGGSHTLALATAPTNNKGEIHYATG
jgi:hypothetical protein